MTAEIQLRDELVRRLRALHALKAGALRMFDPMLVTVGKARVSDDLAEVHDLLGRMHEVFSRHREATADHAARLSQGLAALKARPSAAKTTAVGVGSMLRARAGAIGGMNFGAAARDAFLFEHLEIAQAHLLEQLAERIGDEQTAALAREIRTEDEDQAATIERNFTNVLTLMLASSGRPTLRPPEEDGPA